MLGSGFDSPQRRWMRIGIPVGLEVFVDAGAGDRLPRALRSARTIDVGAYAAIGRDVAAGIREVAVGRIVVRRDPDLLARGGHDVLVAGGRDSSGCEHSTRREEDPRPDSLHFA